jgi:16S rRNA (cytosine967-C5)-methyltransferase
VTVARARSCAFAVLRRVFEQGAYADRALHAQAVGLDRRDRALATALAYGTIQRRATLDHVAELLSSRSPSSLDPEVLAALRLGLFQLLLLSGVAEHAAVNDSVELAKPRGDKLVNAVLRSAVREGRAIVERLGDSTPGEAAVLYSLPGWIAELWWEELGPEEARALMRRCNEPPESALRVNTLVASPEAVRERLPVSASIATEIPEGLVLEGPFDAHGSSLFEEGAIMPQSRASMRVVRMLSPQPGERVLDLCAAPGAKTTHLAALIENNGEVVAVERHRGRADALRRTCARMRASSVSVSVGDAAEFDGGLAAFDRVLVDPPCTGLGTLQSRPDLRWRVQRETIGELALLQKRILGAGADGLAPGGTLVYSVCTISREESRGVVDALLEARPEFSMERELQLLPHRDRSDGFFIAVLRRRG